MLFKTAALEPLGHPSNLEETRDHVKSCQDPCDTYIPSVWWFCSARNGYSACSAMTQIAHYGQPGSPPNRNRPDPLPYPRAGDGSYVSVPKSLPANWRVCKDDADIASCA